MNLRYHYQMQLGIPMNFQDNARKMPGFSRNSRVHSVEIDDLYKYILHVAFQRLSGQTA